MLYLLPFSRKHRVSSFVSLRLADQYTHIAEEQKPWCTVGQVKAV